MEPPQTFPTQAAKDAALLELAESIIYNTTGKQLSTWHSYCDEFDRLKSVPVVPVESVKSAEEIVEIIYPCSAAKYFHVDKSSKLYKDVLQCAENLHQYAAQSVVIPTEEEIQNHFIELYGLGVTVDPKSMRFKFYCIALDAAIWLRNKLTTK